MIHTAEEIYKEAINKTQSYSDAVKLAINEARIEAIKECAKQVKIVRYQPNPFGNRESALASTQRDYIDKHSILKLLDQIK